MAKSTAAGRSGKPQKPYPGFPLFSHATGRWAKKIRQRLHYFGKIADDPEGEQALAKFNREWPYLKDGRTPPPVDVSDGCTLLELVNAFLTTKSAAVADGELTERSFADYHKLCAWLLTTIGKHRRVDDLRPDDFARLRSAIAKGRKGKPVGPVTIRNDVNRVRVIFKFAFDHRLIDSPIHYGQSFNRPSAKSLRRARIEAGPRLFTAAELRTILDTLANGREVEVEGKDKPQQIKSDPILRAMVLLGINCGFGNTDVATLPRSAVDLDAGWINFPRPKTEIPRHIPLWKETRHTLAKAIALRPATDDPNLSDRCFLTRTGLAWVRMQDKVNGDENDRKVNLDPLGQKFINLLKRLKINGRRGLGFYTLRHCFETVAGESKDQVAVNSIMGHVDNSMAGVYRERISDERLQAVVETVREWLWEGGAK